MRQFILLSLLFLKVVGYSQQFADKEYYLVDSLDFFQLTEDDRLLVDSCLRLYHEVKHDTDKVNAINTIVEESQDDNVWPKYNDWVHEFAQEKLKHFSGPPTSPQHRSFMEYLAGALNNIGYFAQNHQDDISKALDYYQKSLKLREELGDKKGTAESLNNIGSIYRIQGDIANALKYYHKSLKIDEELGDKYGIANSLNNIGMIYKNQGDIAKALDYYQKSLKLKEELSDKKGIASSLNNIGTIYRIQGDLANALEYYHKSLKIDEELGDNYGIANSLNNIGYIYKKQGEIASALEYYHKSLKLVEELGYKYGIAIILNNIGFLELIQVEEGKVGALESSEKHLSRGLQIAQEGGYPRYISDISQNLSRLFKMTNRYKEALEMYELHIQMRDSIKNEETQKAAIRQQTKYEFEKAQLVKEQEEKEVARLEAEKIDRRNSLQYSIILVAILVVFGLVLSLGVISVSPKVAEGLIFFAFLILFEFLLVLSDPYVDSMTNGEPMYKLLANALLAGLIFPLHAFFERTLKVRLIKNRRNG